VTKIAETKNATMLSTEKVEAGSWCHYSGIIEPDLVVAISTEIVDSAID
jgi:hypothetical protein